MKGQIKIMNKRNMIFGAILSVVACFVLLPQMRAAPETFLNSNTWDGFNALGSGQASNVFNTAIGWESLALVTTALGNTGCGAGALALNTTGTPNTAVGAGAATLNTTGSANNAVG